MERHCLSHRMLSAVDSELYNSDSAEVAESSHQNESRPELRSAAAGPGGGWIGLCTHYMI